MLIVAIFHSQGTKDVIAANFASAFFGGLSLLRQEPATRQVAREVTIQAIAKHNEIPACAVSHFTIQGVARKVAPRSSGEEGTMSRSLDRDPTRFFSVVGAAYVSEHHAETTNPYVADPQVRKADFATSLAVLVTLITAISVFAGEISVRASAGLTQVVVATMVE
jgi:hypothetical protein